MYDHYFINFVRPPVPDYISKDSAIRHPRFWRRRLLKVFTIYGHGSHLGQWTVTILAIFHFPTIYGHGGHLGQWTVTILAIFHFPTIYGHGGHLGQWTITILAIIHFPAIYGHGGHLGQWTVTILAIFHFPAPGRLQMKFEQHWPRGSRGEVV